MLYIKVFAPGTVANLGCGFDVMGLTLDGVGDLLEVGIEEGAGGLVIRNRSGKELPAKNEDNVITPAVMALLGAYEKPVRVEVTILEKIAPGSGIGSSAASSAAAVWGVNELLGRPFSGERLVEFAMMGEALIGGTPHADNVGPAVLGGVVLGSEERMDALRGGQRASWGACMDPFAAWLLIRSLRTLEVRMARHSASADKVARFLQEHPRVRSVCYPGLETDEGHTLAQTQMTGYSVLMSFVPDADNEAIHAMVKSLDVFEEGPSWGGFESVVNTPGLNPNREMLQFEGIPQGLVRISVGLEDADTLIEDLDRALNTLPR